MKILKELSAEAVGVILSIIVMIFIMIIDMNGTT